MDELTIYQFIFNLQAVVVSIDPRRVYINNPNDVQFQTIKVSSPGEVFFHFSLILIFLCISYLNWLNHTLMI